MWWKAETKTMAFILLHSVTEVEKMLLTMMMIGHTLRGGSWPAVLVHGCFQRADDEECKKLKTFKRRIYCQFSFSLHHLLEIQNVKIYCACEAAAAAAKKSAATAEAKNRRLQQTIQKKWKWHFFAQHRIAQHSLPLQNCYSLSFQQQHYWNSLCVWWVVGSCVHVSATKLTLRQVEAVA